MMKKMVVTFCLAALVFGGARAQVAMGDLGLAGSQQNQLYGGMGLVNIDSEGESALYYNIMARPELAFGKFGIGLDINLNINTETGEIRDADWNETMDYFRLIRYMRYGFKNDPFYARVGMLDASRLGHGSIMNYYTNAASFDDRKLGMALDIDFGTFGFESLTSSFERTEIIALRGYVRPLQKAISVPIIKNIAIGASGVRDFDPDGRTATDDGVTVYGVDAELPILNTRLINLMAYWDWAQIYGYSAILNKSRTFGNGHMAGLQLDFPALTSFLDVRAKFERRIMTKEFVPSFYNAFYEIQRYQPQKTEVYKTDMLLNITDETKGWFGELYGSLLGGAVQLVGNYSYLDDQAQSGIMHLAMDAPNAVPVLAAHASYDKIGIETMKDVFTLDDRSIARLGIGYKMNRFMTLYVDYIWTFVKRYENGERYFEPQERFEPRLVFNYTF